MWKRRGKKHRIHTKEEVWCSVCKTTSIISNSDVEELVCGDCFIRQIFYEEIKEQQEQKQKVTYVTGWNLKKKYKAPDGKVYSFGKEITGEINARNTKQLSKKTKSVSKRGTKTSKPVLSKKDKTGRKKKGK